MIIFILLSINSNYLKYPGATRYFTVKIKNTGSIDALFVPEEATSSEKICLIDPETSKETCTNDIPSESDKALIAAMMENNFTLLQAYEDNDGNIITASSDITEEETNKIIDPETGALKLGASMYFGFAIRINKNLTGNSLSYKYITTMDINFKQPAN